MNGLFVTTRRIDSAWHVVATDDELEHTHQRAFASRREAYRLASTVLDALDRGRDLNLRFWTSVRLP